MVRSAYQLHIDRLLALQERSVLRDVLFNGPLDAVAHRLRCGCA